MIVGVDADARYDAAKIDVPRGSGLYVFSDGVYEFRAGDGTIFGIERFERLLMETVSSGGGKGGVLGRVLAHAQEECTTERFPDDVSLLEVRFD
jgi:serine phosphatase RsbU (regulator of sigma subunit)